MKKLTFPLLALTAVCALFIFGFSPAKRIGLNNDNELMGTWQLCNYNTLEPDTAIGGNPGSKRFKLITEDKFIVIETKLASRTLVGSFSGFYTADKDTYIETIDAKAPNIYGRSGKPVYTFTYKLKGQLLYLNGVDNSFHEVWKRLK